MELKQLEYFLAVSNTQSFTRAAEQLYISQPSVTTAIKKLEDELGIALFDRSKKQAILTSEGKIFYQHAGTVMMDISKATKKAAELKNLSSGTIQLGISPLTGLSTCSYMLAKFHNMHSTLNFTFTEGSTHKLYTELMTDNIDLAVLPFTPELLATQEGLEYTAIAKEPLSVFVPSFHRLTRKQTVGVRDMRSELLLMPQKDCAYRNIIDTYLSGGGVIPHISFSCNYPQTIAGMIIAGSGISILPQGAISDGAVREITLSDGPEITLALARKKKRTISHAAEKLFSFVRDAYDEEGGM